MVSADSVRQDDVLLVEDDAPELQLRTYTPTRILGKGSFGTVYQARIEETREVVAIKSIRMTVMTSRTFKQMNGDKEREVQILKELDGHPNIVSMKGAFLSGVGTSEPKLNLVLEFLSDTLHRVLKHYSVMKKTMDQYHAKLYQYQIMRGIAYFHGKGIVHCDIKPQNLLLDGGSQTLKICDFGTAKRMALGHVQRLRLFAVLSRTGVDPGLHELQHGGRFVVRWLRLRGDVDRAAALHRLRRH